MPRVVSVDPASPDPAAIAEARAVLERGGLVAFPTETVYGLGARGLHAVDVARIFAAKNRPAGHPLILHVTGEPMARELASSWPVQASALARAFWPGPLTLVVPRTERVPDAVTGGLGTVGVRAPRHPVALALIAAVGEPLAAPSANAHMHVSPTTAAHVVRSLGDAVDLVLDAGPCDHGIESTVVDVTGAPPRVLRAGAASFEALANAAPGLVYETMTVAQDAVRASPGLASKHYAPRARVVLASGAELEHVLRRAAESGARVGAVVHGAAAREVVERRGGSERRPALASLAVLPSDPAGYAHALFAAFYDADDAKTEVLVVERVPAAPAWFGVADRLRRAASAES